MTFKTVDSSAVLNFFESFFKIALKRRISAMNRAKNITFRERNRLKSPENGYKRRKTAFYQFDRRKILG